MATPLIICFLTLNIHFNHLKYVNSLFNNYILLSKILIYPSCSKHPITFNLKKFNPKNHLRKHQLIRQTITNTLYSIFIITNQNKLALLDLC